MGLVVDGPGAAFGDTRARGLAGTMDGLVVGWALQLPALNKLGMTAIPEHEAFHDHVLA